MTASDTPLPRKYWLMKTEPSECSFESVYNNPNHTVDWFGIRNYQARNFMRDEMKPGDGVLFYHSSCPMPGIVGIPKSPPRPIPTGCSLIPQANTSTPRARPKIPAGLPSTSRPCARRRSLHSPTSEATLKPPTCACLPAATGFRSRPSPKRSFASSATCSPAAAKFLFREPRRQRGPERSQRAPASIPNPFFAFRHVQLHHYSA